MKNLGFEPNLAHNHALHPGHITLFRGYLKVAIDDAVIILVFML